MIPANNHPEIDRLIHLKKHLGGMTMDKGVFLVKPNISGLFLLRKPCSHKLSFLPSVAQEWHFSAVFSGS